MREHELQSVRDFFAYQDADGVSNAQKARTLAKPIRRLDTTDKNKSYESSGSREGAEGDPDSLPLGVVEVDGKLVGFGIHIYNEDVYPLQSFEIYLRNCQLEGPLDLDGFEDLVFVDIYHNRVSAVTCAGDPSLRILGVQDNEIASLDPTQLPACQGIDAGKNRLTCIDVSQNPELVELYINDNDFTEIDLSHNAKLKYFYCHNNRISRLDTRGNALLRHLNATGNPMTEILALAPQRDGVLPLEVRAAEGGHVGLKFNPIYNAQWKETGEWEQSYWAYPRDGYAFDGWFDAQSGELLSNEATWIDEYGASRRLEARFSAKA